MGVRGWFFASFFSVGAHRHGHCSFAFFRIFYPVDCRLTNNIRLGQTSGKLKRDTFSVLSESSPIFVRHFALFALAEPDCGDKIRTDFVQTGKIHGSGVNFLQFLLTATAFLQLTPRFL